ncbi:hypothetical protein ACROYT_G034490 [Oculina patagonica]
MRSLPEELGKLLNLKTLDLHRNNLVELPASIGLLKELKNLDVSGNKLQLLPVKLGELTLLQILNVNCNELTALPSFVHLKNLLRLDVSHNQLTQLPDGIYELEHLAEIHASNNQIASIDANVSKLTSLKVLSLGVNKIELIPTELSECHKLKDLHLQDNLIKDSKLVKLIKQCHTKAVLDYIATANEKGKGGKKGGKKGKSRRGTDEDKERNEEQPVGTNGPVVTVLYSDDFKILVQPSIQDIRPYIVCTLVRNVDLADMTAFRKFINIQTKLHESVCDHRTLATIATHDVSALVFPLEYEAVSPSDIQLVPLGRHKEITAEQLISDLRTEAMKQKQKTKRNPFKTGLYKYLSLIEGAQLYAVVRDSTKAVVSFPPVTNSERSKITPRKLDVLLEVTSPTDLATCKSVMDSLICKMLEAGLCTKVEGETEACATSHGKQELVIEQVRVINSDGQLKVVYPSRVDLQLESVKVIHQEKQ